MPFQPLSVGCVISAPPKLPAQQPFWYLRLFAITSRNLFRNNSGEIQKRVAAGKPLRHPITVETPQKLPDLVDRWKCDDNHTGGSWGVARSTKSAAGLSRSLSAGSGSVAPEAALQPPRPSERHWGAGNAPADRGHGGGRGRVAHPSYGCGFAGAGAYYTPVPPCLAHTR